MTSAPGRAASGQGPFARAAALEAAAPFLLAVAVAAAFLPLLGNGFVWDDAPNFLANPHFRGLRWENIRWMFTQTYLGPYQPLAWLLAALEFEAWGLRPAGYHLASILLHVANTLLFYRICLRLLGLALPVTGRAGTRRAVACAFGAAAFFGLHPLRVESVAFVTEQRGLLAGVFYLSAVLLYLRAHARSESEGARSRALLAWCGAAYVLSLLSKAAGLALPVTLTILDVYPLRRLAGDPRKWTSPPARAALVGKLPLAAAGLLAAALDWRGYASTVGLVPLARIGVAARLGQAAYGLAFYLRKTAAPSGLLPLYELPRSMAALRSDFVASEAFCVACTAVLWALRRRWPAAWGAWLHYAATLAPVCGLVQFAPHVAADRYSYLSCLGWPLAAAGLALSTAERAAPAGIMRQGPRRAGRILLVAAAGLGAALGRTTWTQCAVWRDDRTLWTHVVSLRPGHAAGLYNLANALAAGGEVRGAVELYRAALRDDPDARNARVNLGIALARLGDLEGATAAFRQALRRDPNDLPARVNLGAALAQRGDLDGAIEAFEEALGAGPSDAVLEEDLGALLARRGRFAEAVAHLRRALDLRPDLPGAAENLRRALAEQGARRRKSAN